MTRQANLSPILANDPRTPEVKPVYNKLTKEFPATPETMRRKAAVLIVNDRFQKKEHAKNIGQLTSVASLITLSCLQPLSIKRFLVSAAVSLGLGTIVKGFVQSLSGNDEKNILKALGDAQTVVTQKADLTKKQRPDAMKTVLPDRVHGGIDPKDVDSSLN